MRNESSGIVVLSWVGAKVLDCLITGHRSADTQWTALPLPPLWLLLAAGHLSKPLQKPVCKVPPTPSTFQWSTRNGTQMEDVATDFVGKSRHSIKNILLKFI